MRDHKALRPRLTTEGLGGGARTISILSRSYDGNNLLYGRRVNRSKEAEHEIADQHATRNALGL